MLSKKNFNRVNIIAEIGVNHNGNIKIAKKLIKAAKLCGADYAKFQIYNTDHIVTEEAKKAAYQTKSMGLKISQKKMLDKYRLSEKQIKVLYNYCKKIGIKFLASVFDEKSVHLLKKFSVDYIKIPSSEITNYFLLNEINKIFNVPIIFSTGMSNFNEINQAYKILKKNNKYIVPMYCVSSYPTKINEINLKKIFQLKKKYSNFGFSDHTATNEVSIICVYHGAKFIEKHLTYNRKARGPDHAASLNPHQFKKFVNSIRNTEKLIKNKKVRDNENKNIKYVRKYLVAKKEILKGERFNKNNLTCKRSGGGLSPFLFEKIKNKKSKKKYKIDQIIYI